MRLLTSKPVTIVFACVALALMTLSVAARSTESDARAGITAFSSHCFSPLLTATKAADVFGFANVRHDFYDLDPFSNAAPSLVTAREATPGTDRRCEVSFYGDFAADAVSAVTERLRQEGIITPADLPAPHEELRTDGTALLAARRLNPNKIAVIHVGIRPHEGSFETFLNVERLRSPQ
ncbi:MAG: succinyl-CoA synthetase subunit beta [Pseudomonadota bacterium]